MLRKNFQPVEKSIAVKVCYEECSPRVENFLGSLAVQWNEKEVNKHGEVDEF